MVDKIILDPDLNLDANLLVPTSTNFTVLYDRISSDEEKGYYKALTQILSQITSGELTEAIDAAEGLFRKRPNSAELYFVFGYASWSLLDYGNAIKLILMAHECDPDCREYVDALATLYTLAGKLSDGLYYAKLSTTLDPHPFIKSFLPARLANYYSALSSTTPSKHYINGLIHYNIRKFETASIACEAELSINSLNLDCYILYGKCLNELGRYDEAIAALKKAIKIDAAAISPLLEIAKSFYHTGQHKDAVHSHLSALNKDQTIETCAAAMDGAQYLGSDFNVEKIKLREAMDSCFNKIEKISLPKPRNKKSKSEIIHIGIFTNSIFNGDYYPFLQSFLQHYDNNKFKIIVYKTSVLEDAFVTQIRNSVHSIRPIFDIDTETLSVILINDRIDILIDLSGYSDGKQITVLKQNIAPVQIGYLQYPFGINYPGTNFVISDPSTSKIDKEVTGNDAQVVTVENGLYSRQPFTNFPNLSPLPAIKNNFITFGGFCDLATLTPDVAACWVEILESVPNSRLALGGVPYICNLVRKTIIDMFDSHSVSARIELIDPLPDQETTNFNFYGSIDIFLDSFLASSITTITEALWMGIPVISMRGDDRASLLGASLLTSAGNTQWIASSIQEYINIVQSLSGDTKKLANIRKNLRSQIEESSLFDSVRTSKSLEKELVSCLAATNTEAKYNK